MLHFVPQPADQFGAPFSEAGARLASIRNA